MISAIRPAILIIVAFGLSACVSAAHDRRDTLRTTFRNQIARCYTVPLGAAGRESAVIEVRVQPNGALSRPPKVLSGPSDAAKIAVRALERCTPFDVTPTVARFYPEWETMVISFDPP